MKRSEIWKKVNTEKNADLLMGLRERWECEKEYEDIADYLEVIKKHIPEAYKIYKRPFGFLCKADDGEIKISLKVSGNYIKIYGEMIN